MTTPYGPGFELQRAIVAMLVADTTIQGWLFGLGPDGVLTAPPRAGAGDQRVYGADADIPEAFRTILPRILVEVQMAGSTWEQPDQSDSGVARAFTHCFAARGDRSRAEAMDQRVRRLLRSTSLSDARIITAELVPTGNRMTAIETAFDDAHRITTPFVSANAGVIP